MNFSKYHRLSLATLYRCHFIYHSFPSFPSFAPPLRSLFPSLDLPSPISSLCPSPSILRAVLCRRRPYPSIRRPYPSIRRPYQICKAYFAAKMRLSLSIVSLLIFFKEPLQDASQYSISAPPCPWTTSTHSRSSAPTTAAERTSSPWLTSSTPSPTSSTSPTTLLLRLRMI